MRPPLRKVLNFKLQPVFTHSEGTRIVQADSGSDSDSDSRRQCAKNVLCLTVRVRIVVAGAGGSVQTV